MKIIFLIEDTMLFSAIDVHSKFHDEHIAFSMASRYLSSAYLTAMKGFQPIAQEHAEFAEIIAPNYKDPREYFIARLFIGHISAFELYIQELVAVVAQKYPYKVGNVQFKLTDVLQAAEPEELIQRATEEVLNKLMYKKPIEYFNDLCEILSINPSLVSEYWHIFIEAKARRDLGVHNGWICNSTYLRKMREAKQKINVELGESLLPTDREYLDEVTESLYKIAEILYQVVKVI